MLFHAWELHSDNLLREYALVTGPDYPYSHADVVMAKQARDALSAHVAGAEQDAAADARSVDVRIAGDLLPGHFSTLQAVLDHGNNEAARGSFLSMPGLPEIVALRNWLCDEAVGQAAGRQPREWNSGAVNTSDAPPAQWPGIEQLPTGRSWLVGDDHNRIIAASAPALALLGWADTQLVGERILAVIPPPLREAHVAAFTHATITDEYRLLGADLPVHAWTRSGATVPITLRLEKHNARGGRSVFVAWLEPRSDD